MHNKTVVAKNKNLHLNLVLNVWNHGMDLIKINVILLDYNYILFLFCLDWPSCSYSFIHYCAYWRLKFIYYFHNTKDNIFIQYTVDWVIFIFILKCNIFDMCAMKKVQRYFKVIITIQVMNSKNAILNACYGVLF